MDEKISVLGVGDDPDQLLLLKRNLEALNKAITVHAVNAPREALRAIKGETFDCIVSGYSMPGMDGVELCRRVKKKVDTPFILYTGHGSEEVAERAFHSGVDDYVRRDADPGHKVLAKRVMLAVKRRRDVAERWRTEEVLRREAGLGVSRDMFEVTEARRRLEALHTHTLRLSGADSIKEIADRALEIIGETFQFPMGAFGVVRDGYIEFIDESSASLPESRLSLDGPGITVRAARTGKSQLVPDTSLDPDFVSNLAKYRGIKHMSELDVPVKIGGKVAAVINLESEKPDAFTEEDRKLLEVFAGHVASSIERVQTLERERRLRGSLEVLHSSAVGLIEAKSIDEVYATCIDVADTILGGMDGTIGVMEGDDLVFRYITRSLRDGYVGFSIPLKGSGIVNRALRAKAAVYVPDVSKVDEYVKPGGLKEDIRYMSELAVPIIVDDEPVAAFNFESVKVDGFDGQARKLLEMLGLYAATAIRRLRILEEERRRAAKLEALLRVAFQLNEAKAPDEVFRIATALVKRDFGYEWVGTGAVEGEWLRYTYYLGTSIGGSDKIHLSQRSVMLRAVKTGETQVVRDVRLDPDYMLLRGVDQSFLSELAVPVKVDGEVRAVINVESTRLDAFTEVDRSLLELLALQVSSSLGRLTRVEDLERQVALKTGELLDAERLAAVGRVASMVAHDLRSPLQSIRNAAYLVKREPSKAMEFCPLIDESVAYASKIVEDLRDATAPIQLKRMPVNLVDIVSGSLDAVEVPDGVEVHRKLGDGFLAASVDPVRLRRALENLVKNAVEAMHGGGVLTVKLTRVGEEAVISVGDTGKGIPEESLPNVFKPFFSTKPRGTGLGLAIAKQSVEAHGGTIEFESVQGVGTVFTVRLPLSG